MHIKKTFITKKLLFFRYLIKVTKETKFNVFLTIFKHIKSQSLKKLIQKKPRKKIFRG